MRRIFFALIATLGFLLLLEAGAWLWERSHPLPQRTIPIPAPARLADEDLSRAFADRLEVERRRLGHGTPMIEDEERGWAMPPRRVCPSSRRRVAGGSAASAISCCSIGVSVGPGDRALTRMPWGPRSTAKARAMLTTAPLLAT